MEKLLPFMSEFYKAVLHPSTNFNALLEAQDYTKEDRTGQRWHLVYLRSFLPS